MERPTKPVMWTDEESTKRFISWAQEYEPRWYNAAMSLLDSEKLSLMHTDTDYFNHFVGLITQEGCKQTKDSLLHDLNIIKPIGRLEYTSEWIDKILSGQKTMSIGKTQYQCGYYELWDTDQKEVKGIVEVTQVEKWEYKNRIPNDPDSQTWFFMYQKRSGFDTYKDYCDYHRTHFQSVKYAITYHVVDMKGDGE